MMNKNQLIQSIETLRFAPDEMIERALLLAEDLPSELIPELWNILQEAEEELKKLQEEAEKITSSMDGVISSWEKKFATMRRAEEDKEQEEEIQAAASKLSEQ